jgi:2-methylisocitrate lyase-like PEP mutase family enzyme
MPTPQAELAHRFRALHEEGFVMPNAWDATSALLLREAGFQALGSSSAALAAALGRVDGRHAVSAAEHLAHAQLLTEVTGLPVNGDFEDGYGETPEDVARTVEAAVAAGLAGLGIEDTSGNDHSPIRPFDEAVARIAAAVRAGRGRIVITGRTDNHLHGRDDPEDTLRRLVAFAEAGADVLYAPFVGTPEDLQRIVAAVAPKPVNALIGTKAGPLAVSELLAIGVRRISLGCALYSRAMGALREAASALAAGDTAGAVRGGVGMREIFAMMDGA